ncbi:MAG: recombinase family protein [Phycisphaerae bacterium]|nr:recombinase family protein [Phycisphaerae bacterium]
MRKKRFVGWVRVSSREQEREGFSLDVQEKAAYQYAEHEKGEIVTQFRIAETATRKEERTEFKRLVQYVKKHAHELDGILCYKIDRATRNLHDYVALEELEQKYGVPLICLTQPTEDTPAGRMMRRTLANMAAFTTEQQSVDVTEGLKARAEAGLFVGHTPYGYRNLRVDGRSIVEVHPENGPKVTRVFEAYSLEGHTLDSLAEALYAEGTFYTPEQPRFPRSTLYKMLIDRSYIGDLKYKGQWLPGKHPPLVNRHTWDRVQELLGGAVYRSHESIFGSELIVCGHCGRPVTGELVTKKTTGKVYVYYRCARYTAPDHPRIRVRELQLDEQVVAVLRRMRAQHELTREWLERHLRRRTAETAASNAAKASAVQKELTSVQKQRDQLLNLRLLDEIDNDSFRSKDAELRDRQARLELQLEACSRDHRENGELAVKVFELSQHLEDKWITADPRAKRQILEMLRLNFRLDGASLVMTMRKPFELLSEGPLVQSSRGDWI